MQHRRQRILPVSAVALLALLAGCTSAERVSFPSAVPQPPAPSSTASSADADAERFELAGPPQSIITGLRTPWSIVALPAGVDELGSVLVSERDTGRVLELTTGGELRLVGTISSTAAFGEGGLLGLAALDEGTPLLFAYVSTADDNRIVRFELQGSPGSYELGDSDVLVSGIPRDRTHNGGRLAIGPDGMLYASTGDAQRTELAQQRDSLAGKILRMTPEGSVPEDNPFDSLVWSYGHRNPQGLAFDPDGRLWASEFGQNTWDELNLIERGGNYGWPVVEGIADREGYIDPVQQWSPSDASPSGLGIVGRTLFMASLRGQTLWLIDVDDPESSSAQLVGELGRLRDAVASPDGRLLVATSNTDQNGSPREGDDRVVAIELAPRG